MSSSFIDERGHFGRRVIVTQHLTLKLNDLNDLRQLWEHQISEGRLFVAGTSDAEALSWVHVVVSVKHAPISLEMSAQVVFAMSPELCPPGQSPGLGLSVKVEPYIEEAAYLMMEEKWGEAAVLLMGAKARQETPDKPANPMDEPAPVRRKRAIPRQKIEKDTMEEPASPVTRPPPRRRATPPPLRAQGRNYGGSSSASHRRFQTGGMSTISMKEAIPTSAHNLNLARGGVGSSGSTKHLEKGDGLETVLREAKIFLKRVGGGDHYMVMGIARDCDRSRVRRAYSQLMLRFHPDNYFRRADQELLDLLEALYQQITVAYETLIVPQRRTAYDMKIGNYRGTQDEGGGRQQEIEQWRRSSFETANPHKTRLGQDLCDEAHKAWELGDRQKATSKLKLALNFHPHLQEARVLLQEIEGT